MHIFVCVLVEQSVMGGVGIVLFHFEIRRAFPGVVLASGITQGDIEIIHFFERAGDWRAAWGSDGHRGWLGGRRATAPAEGGCFGEQEFGLQSWRIVLIGNAGQIAGGRMARIAFAGSIEISLAGFGVARDDVENLRVRAAAERVVHALVQKVRKVGDLRAGQTGRRSAALHGMAFVQKGTQRTSVAIVQHNQ